MRSAVFLCLFAGAAFGQPRPTVPEPSNIDFSQGAIGEMPLGWDMPQLVLEAGYRAEKRDTGCGEKFPFCVAYVTPSVIGKVRAAELEQSFPAEPYIGKSVRFSAWLRMDHASDGGYIHIRMRIYHANGTSDLRDSILPPVDTDRWQQREVSGHVDSGAVTILIWARYFASGEGWVAAPTFGTVDDSKVTALPSFGVAGGSFPVKDAAGHTIRFGAWIKTENVTRGYAGLWLRADGLRQGQAIAFDNSSVRVIEGKSAVGDGQVRGAIGTSDWEGHEIELPVGPEATNIAFGFLLDGNGTAWFDAARIDVDGEPWFNPRFDLDFESPALKGFGGGNSARYKVAIDTAAAYTGHQSLKMQFVEPAGTKSTAPEIKRLDPVTVDETSRSTEYATPVSVTFVNQSSSPVDIYWINYQGNRVRKASGVAVGATWRTGTYLTHPWLVVASESGGTAEQGTGFRIAAFEASGPAGGDAIITDRE